MSQSRSPLELNGSEIAIVGMSCRFPGAQTPLQFWKNLCRGVESLTRLTADDLRQAGMSPDLLEDPNYVPVLPALDDIEFFDAGFFGYTPLEAKLIDPQQRLFLECAWEACEQAGYVPDSYSGKIGVFTGAKTNTYLFNIITNREAFESLDRFQIALGNDLACMATRVAYKFDLRGPSYAIHTACSTSLIAVHLACQSLLLSECDMALAGGAAINVPQRTGYFYQKGGILSPDGHCRTFDADARGSNFGNGVGAVLVKRLEDAIAQRDHIYAIIRGSASNNDGARKASYTAPGVDGQANVLLEAMACAGVEPETISYIEAHGTATDLGDAIEMLALTEAFSGSTQAEASCAIGSVKTNIGHLETAAGIAGLIKTALALEHRQIPPSLHFRKPNPKINFADSPFYVNTQLNDWKRGTTPRRAGVSSFGLGSANVHVILEEPPPQVESGPSRHWQLIMLSARSEAALDAATANLAKHLEEQSKIEPAYIADVAYTLALGRKSFPCRRIAVCHSQMDSGALRDALNPSGALTQTDELTNRRAVFLFPGLGDHYPGMGAGLYRSEPTFKEHVDRGAEILRLHLGFDIRETLYPPESDAAAGGDSANRKIDFRRMVGRSSRKEDEARRQLNQTCFIQPATFVIEYALARLWMSWGIVPQAMIGYSLGEYVAACLAGVLSFEDALAVVAKRAQMIQALPEGAMLAVSRSESELAAAMREHGLSLAAVNGPATCVLSGPAAAVEAAEREFTERGITARRLQTSHAFHSSMTEVLAEPLTDFVKTLRLRAPQIPYISNVTGSWISAEEATDQAYWATHMSGTVRFSEGIEELFREKDRLFLEVGPGQGLTSFVKQHPACDGAAARLAFASLPGAYDGRPEPAFLLETLGKLWLVGQPVDWKAFYSGQTRRRVPLPTYPFERQRYWIDPPATETASLSHKVTLDKKTDISDWFYEPVWKPLAASASGTERPHARWMVFKDDSGLSLALIERLRAAGHDVVAVTAANAFAKHGDREFSIDPSRPEDYTRLISEANGSEIKIGTIAHLWSVNALNGSEDSDRFERCQDLGFYSLLFLAQAAGRQALSQDIRIEAVTSGVFRVIGQEVLQPEKATVLGPVRVIPQEFPKIKCRCVDVSLPESNEGPIQAEAELKSLADRLINEFQTEPDELLVAYRDETRWVQDFSRVPLKDDAAESKKLRENGVYLITGGFGGLGMVLAEHLAQTVRAKLVLVSRTSLPDRSEWAGLLGAGQKESSLAGKIRAVRRLEEFGAEVLAVAADVSDESQMRRAVEEALNRFGTIHGVIHLAGIPGGGIIQLKTREMARQIMSPKVQGALVLEKLFKGRELDFLVLYSSIASILGEFGQADYCAANSFLDALAQRNASRGPQTIVINWDIWQEVGLAVYTEVPPHLREWREEMLRKGISNVEGVEAFDRILASGLPQVIVSAQDLPGRIELGKSFTGQSFLQELQKTGASQQRPARRVIGTNYLAASDDFEKRITEVWQLVLGADQIGVNDNFFDLGGNSLLGLQLVSELSRELGIEIAPVTLFEFATISSLARHLNPQPQKASEESVNKLAERRTRAREGAGSSRIAIIGMSGRFPGAPNVETLWKNLCDGVESVTFFNDDELLASGVPKSLFSNPRYVKAGSTLEDIDQFDAGLFGFSPREAEVMDPQHRIFLECAWEVLERAGYDPLSYKGLIGVFAGSNLSTYLLMLHADPKVRQSVNMLQAILGNDKDSLTTTVSYKLNLRGPSLAVQTFCSTSLVAVHMACQSLRSGECDMALAGGIRVVVPDRQGYLYELGGLAPSDGHTRSFDAKATGSILGNGVGIVCLKRFEDALADGDNIAAVIIGSAINNDGSLKAGYTAPSVAGQSEAILAALDDAGVGPESLSYIEAHGSATELGDPIEVAALTKAFRARTEAKNFCAIGSVKANFGHLDRAAGVTALIKTAMALEKRRIPPSINFDEPNPKIDFANSPFYVNTTLCDWRADGGPLRAGVNSLGMGGTNAHVILEEAPAARPTTPGRPWQLLVLSARTEKALESVTDNLAERLSRADDLDLADVAYTLQLGRRDLDFRRILVCRDLEDAREALTERDPRRLQAAYREEAERPFVFMFPGLGGQYLNMGRGLYDSEPVFRQEVDHCAEILTRYLGFDLRKELYPDAEQPESNEARTGSSINLRAMLGRDRTKEGDSKLDRTSVSQPLLFVIEYALAQLWMSWGMRPQALVGYSLGEYVAACLAGVFSLEDGLKLVAERARMIESLPAGALLAVGLSEDEISPLLGDELSLMAVNGPAQCVASGPPDAIEAFQSRLDAIGASYRRLQATHAFHSRMMSPIFDSVVELASSVELRNPQIPYLSNVTGKWIQPDEATDPAYWARHLCLPVRFSEGVEELLSDHRRVFLEAGPPLLSSLVQQHPAAQGGEPPVTLNLMRHSYETVPDLAYALQGLGKLWMLGAQPDWETLHAGEQRRRVSLPTYPFQRSRYWIDAQADRQYVGASTADPSRAEWFYVPLWKRTLPPAPANGASSDEARRWWVLADEGGLGESLADRLESAGIRITRLRMGDTFNETAPGHFTVRSKELEDFAALLNAEGETPDSIVYLWGLRSSGQKAASQEAGATLVDQVIEGGALSLLALSEALRGPLDGRSLKLWMVSDRLHEVTGEEVLQPEQADLLGACTAIGRDLPGLKIRNLDVMRRDGGAHEIKRLVDQLLSEMINESSERVVAYRGGHRWVPMLAAANVEEGKRLNGSSNGRGNWLVINGLSSVGLSFCEHLSENFGQGLTLIEPPGFPPRELWDEWIANDTGEGLVTAKIKRIRAIEARAEIRMLSTDLRDINEARALIRELSQPSGLPLGVVFVFEPGSAAAGGNSLENRLMRSKYEGLFVLDEVLREHELTSKLLVWHTRGGGPHSAADDGLALFLDTFAASSARNRHQPWTSVTWEVSAEAGNEHISNAIGRLLHLHKTPQVIVSLEPLTEGWNKMSALISDSAPLPTSEPISHYPRPSLRVVYVPPRTAAEQTIVQIWRELLGVDKIGVHDNFLELGGDSLLAVRLISRLRDAFKQELPISVIFEASSVAELAKAVEPRSQDEDAELEELMKLVQQLSEEDAEQELLKRRQSLN
ncbi:MAG: SDR family oxidoreductase [Blastocatellia bacterium]